MKPARLEEVGRWIGSLGYEAYTTAGVMGPRFVSCLAAMPPSFRRTSKNVVVPPRPLTHDLVKDILEATGNELSEVQIVDVKDGVFFANLVFSSGVEVSARPSDSIAIALRTGARVVCADEVLAEAGVAVPAEQEDEVERFREFLDQVTPEDFESL